MRTQLPLSALLSQVLVAFVVEFDNDFERQVPHRTANHGSTAAYGEPVPWLVSMAMWLRYLQFVPEEGIAVEELLARASLERKEAKQSLTRLSKWWGYLAMTPNRMVAPTAGGAKALRVWNGLSERIETRWRNRYGEALVSDLRASLRGVLVGVNRELPDFLPVLGYDLFSRAGRAPASPRPDADSLAVLLAKVLLAFAMDFEKQTGIPLALSANLLRVAGDGSVRSRELPRLTGLSKEAIAMLVKRGQKSGYVTPSSGGSLTLTAAGVQVRKKSRETLEAIESAWREYASGESIAALRQTLEQLVAPAQARETPRVFEALEGYPDGWRASLPARQHLPHYPMVLHRGGFPDGS